MSLPKMYPSERRTDGRVQPRVEPNIEEMLFERRERPTSAKNLNPLISTKARKGMRPISASKVPQHRQVGFDQNAALVTRIRPQVVTYDKEQVYEESLALKMQFNQIQEENTQLKTRLNLLEKEIQRRDEIIEASNKFQKNPKLYNNINLIHHLKQRVYAQSKELKDCHSELDKLRKNIKSTKLYEIETEINTYMEECIRLRTLVEQYGINPDQRVKIKVGSPEERNQQLLAQMSALRQENHELMTSLAQAKEEITRWRGKGPSKKKPPRKRPVEAQKQEADKLHKLVYNNQVKFEQKETSLREEIKRLNGLLQERDQILVKLKADVVRQSMEQPQYPTKSPSINEIRPVAVVDSQTSPIAPAKSQAPKLFRRINRTVTKRGILSSVFFSFLDRDNNNYISGDRLWYQLKDKGVVIKKVAYEADIKALLGNYEGAINLNKLEDLYNRYIYALNDEDTQSSEDDYTLKTSQSFRGPASPQPLRPPPRVLIRSQDSDTALKPKPPENPPILKVHKFVESEEVQIKKTEDVQVKKTEEVQVKKTEEVLHKNSPVQLDFEQEVARVSISSEEEESFIAAPRQKEEAEIEEEVEIEESQEYEPDSPVSIEEQKYPAVEIQQSMNDLVQEIPDRKSSSSSISDSPSLKDRHIQESHSSQHFGKPLIEVTMQPVDHEHSIEEELPKKPAKLKLQRPAKQIPDKKPTSPDLVPTIKFSQVKNALTHMQLRLQLNRIDKDYAIPLILQNYAKGQSKFTVQDVYKAICQPPIQLNDQDEGMLLAQFLLEPINMTSISRSAQSSLSGEIWQVSEKFKANTSDWQVLSEESEGEFDKQLALIISSKKDAIETYCKIYDTGETGFIALRDFQEILQRLNIEFPQPLQQYIRLIFYSHRHELDTAPYQHFLSAYYIPEDPSDESMHESISAKSDENDEEMREKIVNHYLELIVQTVNQKDLELSDVFRKDAKGHIYPEAFVQGLKQLNIQADMEEVLTVIEALQDTTQRSAICIKFDDFHQILIEQGLIQREIPTSRKSSSDVNEEFDSFESEVSEKIIQMHEEARQNVKKKSSSSSSSSSSSYRPYVAQNWGGGQSDIRSGVLNQKPKVQESSSSESSDSDHQVQGEAPKLSSIQNWGGGNFDLQSAVLNTGVPKPPPQPQPQPTSQLPKPASKPKLIKNIPKPKVTSLKKLPPKRITAKKEEEDKYSDDFASNKSNSSSDSIGEYIKKLESKPASDSDSYEEEFDQTSKKSSSDIKSKSDIYSEDSYKSDYSEDEYSDDSVSNQS